MEGVAIFLAKARESLAGAESEFVNSRFDNCTNRCYYACLQAARAALEKAGVKPTEPRLVHGFPSPFRWGADRQEEDYETELISQTLAERALRRAEQFVRAVQEGVTP